MSDPSGKLLGRQRLVGTFSYLRSSDTPAATEKIDFFNGPSAMSVDYGSLE